MFILYVADLPIALTEDTQTPKILMYADDLVLYRSLSFTIRAAFNNLKKYFNRNERKVNMRTTAIIKFRKKSRLLKPDTFSYKEK